MALTPEQKLDILYRDQRRPAPLLSGIAEQGIREEIEVTSQLSSQPRIVKQELQAQPQPIQDPQPSHQINDGYDSSEIEDDYIAACAAKLAEATKPGNVLNNGKVGGHRKNRTKKDRQATSGDNEPSADALQSTEARKYKHNPPIASEDRFGNLLVSQFCCFSLVLVFPYKFLSKKSSDRVAKRFFDGGKIWQYDWEIYYIHPPTYLDSKPVLLVPLYQFHDLIDKINAHYKGALVVPTDPDLGFVVPFYGDGTPAPIYLGCGRDRDHISEMEADILDPKKGYGETPAGANSQVDLSFAAFKKKMETVTEANKRKSKTLKKKRTQDRVAQQQEWCRGLKRAQRYLGLRPRVTGSGTPYQFDPNMSWPEEQQIKQEYAIATGRALEPLDVNKPVPYPFDEKPIIIAIDVESNERDHNQITEVGVSTLDTLDLEDIPPGEGGRNWMAQIRSRHLRIKERMYIINKDFCPGDPLSFHFGKFERVSIAQIGEVFDECFQWPFSVNYKHSGDIARFEEALRIESATHQVGQEDNGSETTGVPDRDASSATTESAFPATLASLVTSPLEHNLDTLAITDPTMKATPTNADQAAANDSVAHALLGIDKVDDLVDSHFWNSQDPNGDFSTDSGVASPDLLLDLSSGTKAAETSRVTFDVNDRRLMASAERKVTTVAGLLNATANQKGPLDRKIILVGHDLPSDIHYLRLLPSTTLDPNKEGPDGKHIYSTILESLDTTHMHKVLVRETQSRSLAHLLVELGITGWDFHNAGNDARYTLEAFIGIALKHRLDEDKRKASSREEQDATNAAWEAEVQKRVDEKRQEAEDLIRTEMAIWDAATGQPRIPSDDELNPDGTVPVNKENSAAPWVLDNSTTFQNDDDHDGGEPTGWNVEPEKQGKSKGSKKLASQKKREAEEWFNEYMKEQIKKEKGQVGEEVATKGSGWD